MVDGVDDGVVGVVSEIKSKHDFEHTYTYTHAHTHTHTHTHTTSNCQAKAGLSDLWKLHKYK